jgi:predicted ATPase with chaperone activity
VKESRERVRAALAHCGYELPAGRITVNLAPADLPKEGGRFDLPIALGILFASGQLQPAFDLARTEFYGELGLTGELKAVPGLQCREQWPCAGGAPLQRCRSGCHCGPAVWPCAPAGTGGW